MHNLNIHLIAKICHEVNRAYCDAIGDKSQKPWDKAPVWQTDSARDGVRFKLNNPSVTPEDMHLNWMREKAKTGWKFGPTKNLVTKTHPSMVPYSELPFVDKIKDVLFNAIVEAHIEQRVDEDDGA